MNVERDEERHVRGVIVVHTRACIAVCDRQGMRPTVVVEVGAQELASEGPALVLRAHHLAAAQVLPQCHRRAALRLRAIDAPILELLLCAHECDISYTVVM